MIYLRKCTVLFLYRNTYFSYHFTGQKLHNVYTKSTHLLDGLTSSYDTPEEESSKIIKARQQVLCKSLGIVNKYTPLLTSR